ncbi:MAG: indolepyruvate ferredoxin oxidoreductase subunit alpha [Syntrophaceae bacterium]|nr:indolepyruvate ferredoxin oxidoreductase subunit alpha [Syntrophaceae bacterium]
MEKVMQGNYAIARGAWEAGAKVACAYPGTPSSEILFAIANQYKDDIYAEWSPNEKVALEVASGASFAGARAIACMKHVGLNVASDPFMTLSYTGVKGGLVIVVADDPYSHSSQNEQDSRHWARFGKVPILEPSDSQECKDFTKIAFEISEQFDTPVLLRSETRVSHSFSPVKLEERKESTIPLGLNVKDAPKYTMIPIYVRVRRQFVEERMKKLEAFSDEFQHNMMEINDSKIGVITSGICYPYTKEIFPDHSYLKLGMVWPLPKKLITQFFKKVEKVIIVEQLDPFLETEIRAIGFKVYHGKDVTPPIYEFSPDVIEKSLKGKRYRPPKERVNVEDLPKRPPNLCSGCSHRPLFYVLKKLGLFVFGDIGCYTLATAPPLNAIHTTTCMGAGVGEAFGASKALGKEGLGKICAVIGDSTFLHAGITPLMDVVYNKGNSTTLILDNETTGMTGLQEHPGTGFTIRGEPTHRVDFEELAKALGVKHVRKVDPYNIKEAMEIIKEEVERDEPSVIITVNGPCMLHRREKRKFEHPFYTVDPDQCRGCGLCLEIGCPAISWKEVCGEEALTKDGQKRKGVVQINSLQCPGCSVCYQICKFEAIIPGKA